MAKRNLSGSLALSKIKHVLMEVKGKPNEDGSERMIKGMFIPFEANKLVVVEKKEGEDAEAKVVETQVYMPVRVIVKDEMDEYKQHGFISKSLDSKDYKALGTGDAAQAAAKEFTPILGSIKEFENTGDSQDSAGNATQGETFTPSDEVPF